MRVGVDAVRARVAEPGRHLVEPRQVVRAAVVVAERHRKCSRDDHLAEHLGVGVEQGVIVHFGH
jgi:hypothetical protein